MCTYHTQRKHTETHMHRQGQSHSVCELRIIVIPSLLTISHSQKEVTVTVGRHSLLFNIRCYNLGPDWMSEVQNPFN